MYSRDYQGKTVNFEASGGLKNASLVMQDQQTDTYWSIMQGEAIAGELSGEKLEELPVGEKMQWRHWREKYPDTLVLSVNGREDAPPGYRGYFQDERGFRGIEAKDDRLDTKEPIFAFHYDGTPFAVPHESIENGAVFELDDGSSLFLYRKKGASMFQSTEAFVSTRGFEERDGAWVEKRTGAQFDSESGEFPGVDKLSGFDTFWYTFSLNNPETKLLD